MKIPSQKSRRTSNLPAITGATVACAFIYSATALAENAQASSQPHIPPNSLVMDIPSFVSLIASLVSLVLGVIAIWLSVVFYRMSTQSAKESNEAAKAITSSVQQLETLFEKLYSDTFTMMKDTYSDMRQHIWRKDANAGSGKGDSEVAAEHIKEKTAEEITQLIREQSRLSRDALKQQIDVLVKEAISKTRELDSKETSPNIDASIMKLVRVRAHMDVPVRLNSLIRHFPGVPTQDIVAALFRLRENGKVTWSSSPEELHNDETILPIASARAGAPQPRPTDPKTDK